MNVQTVHVAVGLIINKENQILIARREAHQHQGDKWEFPGGKLEQGEDPQSALCRELKEELGITINQADFLFDIRHQYEAYANHPAKKLVLHIYQVDDWKGEAAGKEGQTIRWVEKRNLKQYSFPDANKPILSYFS